MLISGFTEMRPVNGREFLRLSIREVISCSLPGSCFKTKVLNIFPSQFVIKFLSKQRTDVKLPPFLGKDGIERFYLLITETYVQ